MLHLLLILTTALCDGVLLFAPPELCVSLVTHLPPHVLRQLAAMDLPTPSPVTICSQCMPINTQVQDTSLEKSRRIQHLLMFLFSRPVEKFVLSHAARDILQPIPISSCLESPLGTTNGQGGGRC